MATPKLSQAERPAQADHSRFAPPLTRNERAHAYLGYLSSANTLRAQRRLYRTLIGAGWPGEEIEQAGNDLIATGLARPVLVVIDRAAYDQRGIRLLREDVRGKAAEDLIIAGRAGMVLVPAGAIVCHPRIEG